MNMPKKWRILNSYNNDINDLSSTSKFQPATSLAKHSRCLYRSKSFTYNSEPIKKPICRSSSLSSITFHKNENSSFR